MQAPQIVVPPPSLGQELGTLLDSGTGTDVQFDVEGELMPAHKIILQVWPGALARHVEAQCHFPAFLAS